MGALIALAISIYSFGLLIFGVLSIFTPNLSLLTALQPFYEPLLSGLKSFLYGQFPDLNSLPFDVTFIAAFILLILLRDLAKMLFSNR